MCFLERPLDVLLVTKIWAQRLLVADELQADLGLVNSALHDFAIGHSDGDRRSSAAQGSVTRQPCAHQAHLNPGIYKDRENPLLAGTAHPSDLEMLLAMFGGLAYHMQLEDCRIHQHLSDRAGQAIRRGVCLEPFSGFIHIQCVLTHSYRYDGGALPTGRAGSPRLSRPATTGASLGLRPRGSLWLVFRKLVVQIFDLHDQLGISVPVCVHLTMLAGVATTTLVTLWDLVRMAPEVLRLLTLGQLTAGVMVWMITILPVADKASTFAVMTAILFALRAEQQRWGTPAAWLFPLLGCTPNTSASIPSFLS